MLATRLFVPWKPASILLLASLFVLSGCGGGAEEALSGFAGGTKSKDKKQMPPVVQSTANPTPEGVVPAEPGALEVEGPATAKKAPEAQVAGRSEKKPLREETQAYRAGRVRDPFRSLISTDDDRTQLVDLSVVKLVGVVWKDPEPFCIVEDTEGISYVLHKGDRVKNGRVVSIQRNRLIASQTILGYTTTVKLNLDKGKEGIHG